MSLRRRLALWWVALAVTFGAVAPAFSHALAWASGSSAWAEVCTAQGSRWVPIHGATGSSPAEPGHAITSAFEHCPFCHLAGHGMAPPPARVGMTLPAGAAEGAPERFFTAPRTAHAWRAAQPRGPPSSS